MTTDIWMDSHTLGNNHADEDLNGWLQILLCESYIWMASYIHVHYYTHLDGCLPGSNRKPTEPVLIILAGYTFRQSVTYKVLISYSDVPIKSASPSPLPVYTCPSLPHPGHPLSHLLASSR